ncbi:hypothetical protein ACFE04_003005 [Oxalis oulophora]
MMNKKRNDRISDLLDDIILNKTSDVDKYDLQTMERFVEDFLLFFRFDGMKILHHVITQMRGNNNDSRILNPLITKRNDYVCMVNHVLQSHQGVTMKGLRIVFGGLPNKEIDNWIQLALNKRSLLDNCPNLEELKLYCHLENMKLSSLSLKHLSISLHNNYVATKTNIYTPNLLSFAYTGDITSKLVLGNVPKLKHVTLYGYWYHIRSLHSQLHELVLDTVHIRGHNMRSFPPVVRPNPERNTQLTDDMWNTPKNDSYKNLKTVKFNGFATKNDADFISYLLDHAPLLDKIIIDPCRVDYLGTPKEYDYKQTTQYLNDRDFAINFSANLPCHVTVVSKTPIASLQ